MALRVAVITASDRASRGEYEDHSGPVAREGLLAAGLDCAPVVLVPDEAPAITAAIRSAIADGARVVLTTGGTGVGPRDVTPEATAALGGRELPGIAEAIRRKGLQKTPFALASRGLAVVVAVEGAPAPALVVNAPGSTGGARDAVAVLVTVCEHVVAQLDGYGH